MIAFRRAYLYVAAAVSLQVLTWGTISLVRNLVRRPLVSSEAAAFQMAVIIVALPIFLAHWRVIQRRGTADAGEPDAAARRVYLFGMLALWLTPMLANLHGLLARLLAAALGTPPYTGPDPDTSSAWQPLLALLVLGVLAAWHARILAAEGAWRDAAGAPATVRRVFLLAFAALGTMLVATAAMQLFVLAATGAYARTTLDLGTRPALPGATARLVVGLLAWFAAGALAQRQYREGRPAERESILRSLYLHFFTVASMLATLGAAAMLLAGALRVVLRLPVEGTGAQQLALLVVGGCGWLYHTLVLAEDSVTAPRTERQESLVRIRRYLVAGIALSAAVVAVAGLIQAVIRSQLQTGVAEALRSQLAWATAFLAVAVPPWVVMWARAQAAVATEGDAGSAERASTARRLYLYFFLLLATVVVLSSTIHVVFRAITAAMGTTTGAEVGTRVTEALAYALVGAVLWLFQARQIREDDRRSEAERRVRAAAFRVAVLDPGEWPAADAVVRALAAALPAGTVCRLRLASPSHGDGGVTEATSSEPTWAAVVRSETIWATDSDSTAPNAAAVAGAAAEAAGIAASEAWAAAHLAIAPWPAPGSSGEMQRWLDICTGTRLLIARRLPGWEWLGADLPETDEVVRQAVHAARQMVAGGPFSPARRWTALNVVGALILGLVLLVTLVLPVARFVMGGGFLDYMAQ